MSPIYRLAILADIHGNLPALEAVLADLRADQPLDVLIAAGDLVVGPQQEEVMQRLQDIGARMLRGNNEEKIAQMRAGTAPAEMYSAHQFALARWCLERLTPATLDLLDRLPLTLTIELPGAPPVLVFHGTPWDANTHLHPRINPGVLERAFGEVDAPVLVCGHSHEVWQVARDGRLAFNPGAVCGPLDGRPGAQYALLDWDGQCWAVTFRHVLYDLQPVFDTFRSSGLLDTGPLTRAFLASIATGQDIGKAFIDYAYQRSAEAGFGHLRYVPDVIWDEAGATFAWEELKHAQP